MCAAPLPRPIVFPLGAPPPSPPLCVSSLALPAARAPRLSRPCVFGSKGFIFWFGGFRCKKVPFACGVLGTPPPGARIPSPLHHIMACCRSFDIACPFRFCVVPLPAPSPAATPDPCLPLALPSHPAHFWLPLPHLLS